MLTTAAVYLSLFDYMYDISFTDIFYVIPLLYHYLIYYAVLLRSLYYRTKFLYSVTGGPGTAFCYLNLLLYTHITVDVYTLYK